jgi:hypothetical protein
MDDSQNLINQLEESLRGELLNSEEQRAYIQVLKQALETKLQEGVSVPQTTGHKDCWKKSD